MQRRSPILLAILLAGAALRIWGIGFGLPHVLAHPDESRVAKTAVDFLGGNLNPGFFNYPTFFMYALGLAYAAVCGGRVVVGKFDSLAACAASWPHDWEPFFLTARVLSAAAGIATIAAIYRVGTRVAGEATGLAAAAFLAVAFLHVRDSHFGVTDVAMTALLCGALASLLRAHDEASLKRFAFAGFLAGLATSTKYNAVFLIAAALVSQALRWREDRTIDARLTVFAVAMMTAFVAGSPYVVLDWPAFWRDVTAEAEHLQAGHAVRLDIGWRHHALVTLPLGLTIPLYLTSLAGIVWMAFRIPARAALLLAFPVVYYIVAGRGYTVFARYMVPVVPFLCVAAGYFAASASRILASHVRGPRFTHVLVLMVAAVAGAAAVKSVRLDRLLARTDSRVLAAQWIAQRVPQGSTIYLTGADYGRPDLSRQGRPAPYQLWGFDEVHATFVSPRGATAELPQWIVVQQSPLIMYSSAPDRVRQLVERYALRQSFRAVDMSSPHVYDQQDAWYLPLDGFAGVGRPGPNILIYELRD